MSTEEKLNAIRERIDALDKQVQELINERAKLAQEVAKVKLAAGDEAVFYRPEREAQVLRRVKDRNSGPVAAEDMARLFREVMSICLALEQPLSIAYFGPEGSFTQAAALKHFGHSVKTVPLTTIDEVFREVEAGGANYGVVPVENSTEGVINHTLDRLVNSTLRISGEVQLRVHHNLVGVGKRKLAEIDRIYSHSQSFAQCRKWLDAHLPRAERVTVSNNAEGARRAAQDATSLAVAPLAAAELYGLQVIEANIEDQPDNTTRFLVIGTNEIPPSGDDKTSLLVSTRNNPGALFHLLEPLAKAGVSLTRIESRPSQRGTWDYVFFLDIDGHSGDPDLAEALKTLKREASLFRILGAYPKAVL